MSLPPWLRALLPRATHRAWENLSDLVPSEAYLVGGTALAVHLRHGTWCRGLAVLLGR